MAFEARSIHVKGIVQGVGFRPFVFRLAHELRIGGWVLNAVDGVHIHGEGSTEALDAFLTELEARKPEAAVISSLTWQEEEPQGIGAFRIKESEPALGQRTLISPDLATCTDCLSELLNTQDRRYRYPFINCTNCGPRFTIIADLPYDRPKTTMAPFALCPSCEGEYREPLNRRFHAQPNACFSCGPHLEWYVPESGERVQGLSLEQSNALICRAAELLLGGGVLALKGLGGYHLATDATNEAAVMQLRKRKERPRKPLAVMAESLQAARQLAPVSAAEAKLLTSAASPIVLLRLAQEQGKSASLVSFGAGYGALAPSVVAGLGEVGIMLPATPVQHLLLKAVGRPLVMTSGNISGEPIVGDDAAAEQLLGRVADAFLLNDRPIISRYDDSVLRVLQGQSAPAVQYVRRARGYAPVPLPLSTGVPKDHVVLAVGSEQKSTICLASGEEAFVSQHLGDLANASAFSNQLETIALYERLFRLEPTLLAADLHPAYLSTKWAHETSEHRALPLFPVQHHHAHIAAVLAENLAEGSSEGGRSLQEDQEVVGIALDGTGYGTDGTLWGGEILIASLLGFRRVAHLEQFRLPGGEGAIKHPLRAAYALLYKHELLGHPAAHFLTEQLGATHCALIKQMLNKGLGAPLTSSAGRYFDAMSALLGVCNKATYEGEPAILLEAAMGTGTQPLAWSDYLGMSADAHSPGRECLERAYERHEKSSPAVEVEIIENAFGKELAFCMQSPAVEAAVIPMRPILLLILNGLEQGVSIRELAFVFHEALMQALVGTAVEVCEQAGIGTVALSGGVFNNRYLATHMPRLLQERGLSVLTHNCLPPNDGCISYGQAAVAAARLHRSKEADRLGASCV